LFVVILAAVGLEIAIGGLFVWLCLARYSAHRASSAGAIHDPELPAHRTGWHPSAADSKRECALLAYRR
jgi:hypothetical protein